MFTLLFVVVTLIFAGCNNKHKSMHSVLERSDLMLESDPELVYSMLDSIILPESYPEGEFVHWCLLYGRAMDISIGNYLYGCKYLYYSYCTNNSTEKESLFLANRKDIDFRDFLRKY